VADRAHRAVLGVMVEALRPLLGKAPLDTATAPLASCRDREGRLPEVACQGTSDLALAGRKFSGNSVRMKREHLLYHGTLLHDFPLDLIERCLAMPPRQPEYRRQRPHREFVVNLPLPAADVRKALAAAWGATEPCPDWPRRRTAQLVAGRYGRREWNEAGA
jgi:lipoate-protein ligase A